MRINYAEAGYFHLKTPNTLEFVPGVDVDVAVEIMYDYSQKNGGIDVYAIFNDIELGSISSNSSLDKIGVMKEATRRFWINVGKR